MPFPDTMQSVCFGNGKFVAVGVNGVIHTSSDGLSWDEGQRPYVATLNKVIFANGRFMAVGSGGAIITSTNGLLWNSQASSTTDDLFGLTFGNGTYAACGAAGRLVTSTDGFSWTATNAGPTDLNWISYGNGLFIVPCQAPNAFQILVSSDLRTWITATVMSSFITTWPYMPVEFGNGTWLATAADKGEPYAQQYEFYSSPDATHWTQGAAAEYSTYYANHHLLFENGLFYYFSLDTSSLILTSDGTTRTYSGVSLPSDLANANDVTYADGRFALVGNYGKAWTSTDTTNWNYGSYYSGVPMNFRQLMTDSNQYLAVADSQPILISSDGMDFSAAGNSPTGIVAALGFDGSNYVAVGGGQVYISTTSTTWVPRTSNTPQALAAICRGPARWVAVGANGTVISSPNALAWTLRSSGTGNGLNGVDFGNGVYVAVGNGGTIISSPDGGTWDVQFSGVVTDLNRVRFLNGQFLALGADGTVLTSSDGGVWSVQSAGTTAALYDIAFGDSRYFVAGFGDENVFLVSSNGVNWQDITVKVSANVVTDEGLPGKIVNTSPARTVAYLNGSFWIAGDNGLLLRSDSAGGMPRLTGMMLPGNGGFQVGIPINVPASYRIQVSTNLAAAFWRDVATNSAPSTTWTDTNTAGSAMRFYRVVSP